jgi:ectoine hydroxylase-related dioxygenase (phytanoyl-CoA dioxygenase family)
MIDQQSIKEFRRDGYVVTEQLFSAAEVKFYIDHYTTMREAGSYPGDKDIPYSRMVHMHRWDDTSLRFMLDKRLANWVRALTDTEPYAVQSLVYLKPPGALGQALHQDQYYLRSGPGSCIAAWVALDPSDEENGCLQVVPGSQDLPLLCTEPADMTQTHTGITVPVPDGMEIVPLIMAPGDVVFFNGSLIHGSYNNLSKDRFRRAVVAHYVTAQAERVAQSYHPVLRMDGSMVELEVSEKGGPCGIWIDRDGSPAVEMVEPTEE